MKETKNKHKYNHVSHTQGQDNCKGPTQQLNPDNNNNYS